MGRNASGGASATRSALITGLLLSVVSIALGDPPAPVSFSKQVLPLLQTRCMGCHGGPAPASGYSMVMRDRLILGGRHGAAIVKGKGAQSPLVRYLTGDLKPKMPPDGAVDLERIFLIRRWIDEGAKIDGMIAPAPAVISTWLHASSIRSPHSPTLPAPVTALAYSPDGTLLAVGCYRTVRLLDASSGMLKQTLRGASGQVQGLAWSSDGKLLAVAGGVPAVSGEVLIFDCSAAKSIMSMTGHLDVVYSVCWKPQSREVASASLDKTVRIWNTVDGACRHVIKDHADGVFSVAYSPDGKLLASGSADRSVKLFETAGWKRVAALTAHQDSITHVAFNQNGTLLASAGADRQLRVWKIDIGKMENPIRSLGEDDAINACAFSPDGSLLVFGGSDHRVKVFNGDGANQKREMKEAEDWVYTVAVGSDNRTVAAGTQDGRIFFWDVAAGRLVRSITMMPDGPKSDTPAEVRH